METAIFAGYWCSSTTKKSLTSALMTLPFGPTTNFSSRSWNASTEFRWCDFQGYDWFQLPSNLLTKRDQQFPGVPCDLRWGRHVLVVCVFKFVCNNATTLSIPNLALSRSYSFKFCGLLVDADRPRPLPLGLRSALKTDVMHFDFVVPLSLHKFLMKSRDVTDLHQHRARAFVAEDGCQVALLQLLECQSHKRSSSFCCLGLPCGSVHWILASQQLSRTHIPNPGKILLIFSSSGSCNFVQDTMFLLCLLTKFTIRDSLWPNILPISICCCL